MALRQFTMTRLITLLITLTLLLAAQVACQRSPGGSNYNQIPPYAQPPPYDPQAPHPQAPRQQDPRGRGEFDLRQVPSNQLITVTFINKSGRLVNMFQSDRNQFEVLFQFSLRPNEPRTIRFRPDNSFWVAYDKKTRRELLINRARRYETYRLQQGYPYDARVHTTSLPPAPYPRGRVGILYVHILVVVDDSMIAYYGEDGVTKFTLTLMNVAARAYMHRSLGIPIILAVVGLEKMRIPPPYYKVIPHKPHLSGGGGCRYASQFQKIYNHTFAITLTRRDIGPSGFAPMYTMCTKRSCALVRVTSLDSGYVIAHELGHALGIDHDEEDRCGQRRNARGGNIMARKMFSTSSNYKWSRCSGRMFRQNLKYFKCLKKKPIKMMQQFRDNMQGFPGQYFNATEQCRMFHDNRSTACTNSVLSGSCRYLLCHPVNEKICRPSRWHAPLEGTPCGKGDEGVNWCIHGTCRNKAKMLPVHGNWSKWSKFTPTCNESSNTLLLLQTQTRNCTNPRPKNGGRKCKGESVMYRVVVPYESGNCRPYTLKNVITRRKHQTFQSRINKLLGTKDEATEKFDAMMFPCTSSNAKGKSWTEFPGSKQSNYLKSKNFSCDFETPNSCSWKSSKKGAKEWTLRSGKTPSYRTGPDHDHTFKNKSGKYVYLEASYVEGTKPMKKGSRLIFESPLVLSSTACLRFAYHMYGQTMGTLEVRVRNGKHSRKMWTQKGNKGNKWHNAEISLALNIEYVITFEGIRGRSYNSDIALDDISLTQGLCNNDKAKADECTSVCVNEEYSSMLRMQLPTGTPCRNSNAKNNVCLKRVCKPVNCRGIIGKTDC